MLNIDPMQCIIQQFLRAGLLILVSIFSSRVECQDVTLIDLREAALIIPSNNHQELEKTAAQVLREEIIKRTALKWKITQKWPGKGPVIAITIRDSDPNWPDLPSRKDENLPENKPEGYRLLVNNANVDKPIVWIIGSDYRGLLFGIGRFLRLANWGPQEVLFPQTVDIRTAPMYPIRGHQLGYRARANSYDAWDVATYEQYIRDLIFFGTNCIENIPFEDNRPSPHMTVTRNKMNVALSNICAKYDLDYWVWIPAVFDLNDKEKRTAALKKHEDLYKACPRLDAVFFPGGDPGNNHPRLVMPFLKEVGKRLLAAHPEARVWISLQGFNEEQVDYFYAYIDEYTPDWLGGLVAGPSSPSIPESRKRLPQKYRIRHYPDITHTVRCQFPVFWWDMAYNLTLGRECPNPQPLYYAQIHNWYGPYTNGFLTYSDGIHDDVNKVIWNACGWDPTASIREVLKDYSRLFFRPNLADDAADGILALEKNWEGSLALNGSVRATLSMWDKLAKQAPELKNNWRWQLCLLRSTYDAYIRERLRYETKLEKQANETLADAQVIGSDVAMDKALTILNLAINLPVSQDLRKRVEELCQRLFESIGLQTSVKKYNASGGERGAILDYVDYPLNNRWWLEDEFSSIRQLASEKEKLEHLRTIYLWENPGHGSFYDDLGNVANSHHVVRGDGLNTDPEMERNPNPGYWWSENGFSRERLSWQVTMDWPLAVRYENLDPESGYIVRMTGYGQALTYMNGQKIEPVKYGMEIGEIKEFAVPVEIVKSGQLIVTWKKPNDEEHLNWRQQSRVAEIWLLKQ